MNYIWIFLTFLIGSLIPFQGIVTANLSRQMGHPFGAAFINFLGGMICFSFAIYFSATTFPDFKKLATIPWYLYTGGLVGSAFILGAVTLLPKIGSSTFFGQIVLGQLLMTLIVDHFGLFGLPIYRINGPRLIGISLIISGSFLILKK